MNLSFEVRLNEKLKLEDCDPEDTFGVTKEEAVERMASVTSELGEMQELLYAAAEHSVLVILQGMDTSGKDGTIKHVMDQVNPQGCRVETFKVPTAEELAHDFLWRVHKVAPRLGMVTIFNRSHYEDVLVVRVHSIKPKAVWHRHYAHINDFERLLADSNTIILKFFLYINKDEQRKRLEAREEDVKKAWKLSVTDWQERELWDDYEKAYEDALSQCSSDYAPWHIVPANKKWFRNLAVAETMVQVL